jgi:hypothetical protein
VRISKILARRDELVRESDISEFLKSSVYPGPHRCPERVEARVDKLVRQSHIASTLILIRVKFAEMETKRDLSQSIVHIDMDAFYGEAHSRL